MFACLHLSACIRSKFRSGE